MKRMFPRIISIFLFIAMICTFAIPAMAADSTVTVSVPNMKVIRSDARAMLADINEFRTGSGVWYWNEDNTTKTVFNVEGGTTLSPLVYNYDLEKTAIQRAIECAINFSHTRPDGTKCWNAFIGDYRTYAENIAAGQNNAAAALECWKETNSDYDYQGHRRNMLETSVNAIGIGHVVFNGVNYWVQDFGKTSVVTIETPGNDEVITATIQVATQNVTKSKIALDSASATMNPGQTLPLPAAAGKITLSSTWPSGHMQPVDVDPEWTITSGEDVVAIANGQITAQKPGKAVLQAAAFAGTAAESTAEFTVNVDPISLENAKLTLSGSTFAHGNAPVEPGVTVALNGKTLVKGTDYTLSYENNNAVGTATATVNGIGNYTGTLTADFTITHNLTKVDAVPANCQVPGNIEYYYCACGMWFADANAAEVIADHVSVTTFAPHVPGTEHKGTDATCITAGTKTYYDCSGCGRKIDADGKVQINLEIPATGIHVPGTEHKGTAATCIAAGTKTYYDCTGCGEMVDADGKVLTDLEIPATGIHVPGAEHEGAAATCITAGTKTYYDCTGCGKKVDAKGNVLTNLEIPATGTHVPGTEHKGSAPSCEKDGTKTYYDCTGCGKSVDAAGNELTDLTIAKLGHVPVMDYTDEYHWQKCDRCFEELGEKQPHILDEAGRKCTVTGCKFQIHVCSDEPSVYWDPMHPATMEINGQIGAYCCPCGKTFRDPECLDEIPFEDYIIQPVKTVKLSASAYTYDGTAKTPSVVVKDAKGKTLVKGTDYTVSYASGRKNVGTYKVVVKGKGNYAFTKTLTFKINPVKTAVSKLTAAKKAFTVKWSKKTNQTTGYQIQFGLKKDFSGAKTLTIKPNTTVSKIIKNLKAGKTYFVRIRTFRTVDGVNYYSGWSGVKSVKTLK